MSDYRIRPATIADADILIQHRIAMFQDMDVAIDVDAVTRAFRAWLDEFLGNGTYRAWLVESPNGDVVGGGGMTMLPWPPGPRLPAFGIGRLAFVYNVYTERAHRRRGLARRVMETIHQFCADSEIPFVALNASPDGKRMYEAMGYGVSPSPMMFFETRSGATGPPRSATGGEGPPE